MIKNQYDDKKLTLIKTTFYFCKSTSKGTHLLFGTNTSGFTSAIFNLELYFFNVYKYKNGNELVKTLSRDITKLKNMYKYTRTQHVSLLINGRVLDVKECVEVKNTTTKVVNRVRTMTTYMSVSLAPTRLVLGVVSLTQYSRAM